MTLQNLKAEAARRGLTLSEVFQEAAHLSLSRGRDMSMLTETDDPIDLTEDVIVGRTILNRLKFELDGKLAELFPSDAIK